MEKHKTMWTEINYVLRRGEIPEQKSMQVKATCNPSKRRLDLPTNKNAPVIKKQNNKITKDSKTKTLFTKDTLHQGQARK